MEAADLGARLCQSAAPSVYRCHGVVMLPVAGLAMASAGIADWMPWVVLWWSKPWLDRTILFVLSRAAFGQTTSIRDVWRSQRQVWWSQLVFTWTMRRLSLWRSLTQPVFQLEGASALMSGARARQIRRRKAGPATLMTMAFSLAETALTMALVSLLYWFSPAGPESDLLDIFSGGLSSVLPVGAPLAYPAVVYFLEPFYVAAGFALYLTRRAELEAWDIEQEFRRAFAY